jgi:hypothetical protein
MTIELAFLQSNETLIPFLFVLAIVFGALGLVRVFNRGVSFLIAVSLAFFVVSTPNLVNILWSYFGGITAFFIAIFFIAFIFEVFGVRRKGEYTDALIINGAILFILLSIGYLYIDLLPPLPLIGGGQNLLIFFALIFILVIFWLAFKAGPQPIPIEEKHTR